jgi:hypothetical protein
MQIAGITHTTEFDDNHRTEIEQKRARRTTAHMTKMACLFAQGLHGDTQAGPIVSVQEWSRHQHTGYVLQPESLPAMWVCALGEHMLEEELDVSARQPLE